MKTARKVFVLVLLLALFVNAYTQTTIWLEDFPYTDGTTQGSGTPAKWTRNVSACTFSNTSDYFEVKSNQMAGRDMDGQAVWTSQSINISGYSNVSLSANATESGGMEATDYIMFYYRLNGGAETLWAVNGNNVDDFTSVVASQTGLSGTSLIIVIRVYNNANTEIHYFDNVRVSAPITGDNCTSPIAINEVSDLTFTTVGATAGGNNPGCGGTSNPLDIWFAYTATATGTGSFDLCGSNFNTRLAIYSACGGTVLACNDDNGPLCTGTNASLRIPVTSGSTYYVQVSGNEATTGTGDLTIAVSAPPANNNCSAATAINEVSNLTFNTSAATASGINPGCGGTANPYDIWYAYTATASGTGSFDLCGSSFNTRLAIYNACGGTLLGCNDDDGPSCSGTSSSLQIPVLSGTTYYVQVSGNESSNGSGDLSISVTLGNNDFCNQALPIGEVTDLAFTTVGATAGGVNPSCGGTTPIDIWFAYTASSTGTGSFDLCGSSYDTRLAVWDACSGNELACNDDSDVCGSGSYQSFLNLNVSSGTTYYVQVGGYNSNTGAGDLTISVSSPPINNDCANAIPLASASDLPFTTVAASASGITPSCGGTAPVDIWYAYTPTISGTANIDLCGSGYDTRLAVWNACGGTQLACNDDNGPACTGLLSSLQLAVTGGTTYYVQVGGYDALNGSGDLTISIASATAGIWTGAINTDWSTGGNWLNGVVPSASVTVQINSGLPNYPVVDETASCADLNLANGASLTIGTGADLSIGGDLTGDGSFIVNDGVCAITGDLNNTSTALVDINGGVLSMDGWYETGYFTWASGVVQLSGGTINVATNVAMSNANGNSVMDGPFSLNVGGTVQLGSVSFSDISGGTITLTTLGYALPPLGDGTFAVYNLVVNGTGSYILSRDATVNRDSIVNNLEVLAGTLQLLSDDGTGKPDVLYVGNNLTVADGATLDVDVADYVTIVGNLTNNGTATFDNNTYNVQGNVSIGTSGLLDAGTGVITLDGAWANSGTFNASTGTVSFNGSTTISGTSTTEFYDAIIETGKTLSGPAGGTFKVGQDFTNNGTFAHNQSTMAFNGTIQSIGGASSNLFNNLTIEGGSITTMNTSGQSLAGVLLSNGILNTNGYLTLISDADQTALIDGSGSGSVIGNITMQNYLLSGFGYKYYSSPCTNATVSEFGDDMDLSAPFPTFYLYDESRTSAGWVEYTTPANPLVPLIGYAVNFGTALTPLTTDISGIVSNGSQGPLTLYNNNNAYTKGFNLVGNPYPSPIDWDAASGWTRTNIDDAIYYFDAGSTDQYVGTYSTYINGVSSDGDAEAIIGAMQGFFIHVSDGAYPVTASFGMNNNVRVNTLSPLFHKSGKNNFDPLLRLSINYSDVPEYVDQCAVYFTDYSSSGFDKRSDALKLMNTDLRAPNIYSISADQLNLSIQSLQFEADSITTVPIGIRASESKWLTFKADDQDNFPIDMQVYLRDIETGLHHTLSEGTEQDIFVDAGVFESRFSLVFAQKDIRQMAGEGELYYIYSSGGYLFVDVNTPADCKVEINISNLGGQLVWREEIEGNGYHQIKPKIRTGIYIATSTSQYGIQSFKFYHHSE
jgi:hypothetical protein